LNFRKHAQGVVADETGELEFRRQAVDERPEPNTLNNARDREPRSHRPSASRTARRAVRTVPGGGGHARSHTAIASSAFASFPESPIMRIDLSKALGHRINIGRPIVLCLDFGGIIRGAHGQTTGHTHR
jgi:hypothetical protein